MKIKFTERSKKDLNDIWLYTFENWSKNQANIYFNGIVNRINRLNDKNIVNTNSNYKSYKYFIHKSHIVFYKKTKTNIVIIRILHKSMDIESRL